MNNIKTLLKEKGMKQRELAAILKMDGGQLNRIILSKNIPSVVLAFEIAKGLGVSVEEIWTEEKPVKEKEQKNMNGGI